MACISRGMVLLAMMVVGAMMVVVMIVVMMVVRVAALLPHLQVQQWQSRSEAVVVVVPSRVTAPASLPECVLAAVVWAR